MRVNVQLSSEDQDRTNYIENLYQHNLSPEFILLAERARNESRKLNKEGISVSLNEAYLISELVRQSASKRFIELGSLTGYSALFILRALKYGGELFCFEKDENCADFIENLFSDISSVPELSSKKVFVRRGDARDSLDSWVVPKDVGGAFIDANKGAYLDYLNWLETHLSGSFLVIADNVFLGGGVHGKAGTVYSKKQIQIMCEFNKKLMNVSEYDSFFVETAEGLLVAKKK